MPQTIGWLLEYVNEHSSLEKDWNWMMGDFLTMVTGGTYVLPANPRTHDAKFVDILTASL